MRAYSKQFMVYRTIAMIEMSDKKTDVNLKSVSSNELSQFNISARHIHIITTDNGTNMFKAV